MNTQGRIPKKGTRTCKQAPKNKKFLQGAKITKKTKISEIVEKKLEAVGILFDAGMGCIGCPMAQQETLEQGCLAHGMSEEKINELIERLNK